MSCENWNSIWLSSASTTQPHLLISNSQLPNCSLLLYTFHSGWCHLYKIKYSTTRSKKKAEVVIPWALLISFLLHFFHWVVDLTRVISERTSGRQTGVKRSKHLSGWCHKIDIRKSGGERETLTWGYKVVEWLLSQEWYQREWGEKD